MSNVLTAALTVGDGDIDELGHVNNIVYVAWMQAVAIEHSTACGWPLARYLEAGAGWVVRSHFIRYKRPAFAGEAIEALTWVHDFSPRTSTRRYLFRRAADRQTLAEAETVWAYVDLASGRPRSIPEDLRAAFAPLTPEEEEAAGWR